MDSSNKENAVGDEDVDRSKLRQRKTIFRVETSIEEEEEEDGDEAALRPLRELQGGNSIDCPLFWPVFGASIGGPLF